MAIASGIGATTTQLNDGSPLATFFGEDQGRYLITAKRDDLDELLDRAGAAGIFMPWIGTTGGSDLRCGEIISISVAKLREAYETWFPAYMKGAV